MEREKNDNNNDDGEISWWWLRFWMREREKRRGNINIELLLYLLIREWNWMSGRFSTAFVIIHGRMRKRESERERYYIYVCVYVNNHEDEMRGWMKLWSSRDWKGFHFWLSFHFYLSLSLSPMIFQGNTYHDMYGYFFFIKNTRKYTAKKFQFCCVTNIFQWISFPIFNSSLSALNSWFPMNRRQWSSSSFYRSLLFVVTVYLVELNWIGLTVKGTRSLTIVPRNLRSNMVGRVKYMYSSVNRSLYLKCSCVCVYVKVWVWIQVKTMLYNELSRVLVENIITENREREREKARK